MRSSDNYYCLEASIVSCNVSKEVQIELWHERLGHMNFRDLRILDKFNVVRGLPKLRKKANGVCGPCQQGKQTKSKHKKGKYISTKEPLEEEVAIDDDSPLQKLVETPMDGDENKGATLRDPLHVPAGPITRAKAKRFKEALNSLIQDTWADSEILKSKMSPHKDQGLINIINAINWAE
ncbi:hypothetical protein LWI28_019781 [Acer negundo]|uniref:GAG-pre-integrase domain-containing protein n=1 Tax=Acer negundo TaxID=4023 RepID=A0AAD5ISB7_ACENE|nr:hypothetical protein LWI28_019781 [Acer negundo]